MITHKQLRAKALGRTEVKAEFDQMADEYVLLDEFLKARAEQGLTQAQVAEKIGTTQSLVANLTNNILGLWNLRLSMKRAAQFIGQLQS